jgi:hypothetical protein
LSRRVFMFAAWYIDHKLSKLTLNLLNVKV